MTNTPQEISKRVFAELKRRGRITSVTSFDTYRHVGDVWLPFDHRDPAVVVEMLRGIGTAIHDNEISIFTPCGPSDVEGGWVICWEGSPDYASDTLEDAIALAWLAMGEIKGGDACA